MSDLRAQLQTTLSGSYTIERELGGGGMSRVFLAEESALGRQVVVKVLSPELAAGLNVERFRREIQLAAKLQHPHIVPVLTTGETHGLPYYTMPYVAGESLRALLGRGPLPTSDAVGILRDVARALAFAHKQGVVHRDIKPENILLTEGSAAVTDFGIAKALVASKEGDAGATLTQIGTSLGTPAYMAPEQIAGDPGTDRHADIYSFGAMAYELFAGRPPFVAANPQRVLAAHLSETPQPLLELRPDLPLALAELVMACLAKEPAARPQSASDLVSALDGAASTQEGPPMPAILLGGPGMWKKALLVYAAAFVVVTVLARAAIIGIGLPDWVFPGALVVMGLGLPVILVTAYVHRVTHRAMVSTPTLTPGGHVAPQGTVASMALKASPHLSWRRTAAGGAWAVGTFIVLIAVWMVTRAMGIGPAASLMAAGKLGDRERVILADFRSPASDSALGPTVTEALRADLAQSTSLSVMTRNGVREVLQRMQRPATTSVDFPLAREIASREGIKAVIEGEVVSLGGSYVIAARLVGAQDGEELASFRETADAAKDIIPSISRLSRKLRSKVGESLRTVQNARSLDKVTTSSLQALQKYVAGVRAFELDGDFAKGSALLDEAIALDTGFAMAYRKLAIELGNRGLQGSRTRELLQKAYDHRERLSDAERLLTIGSYYSGNGPAPDLQKAIAAYESLLELDPRSVPALNNVAALYRSQREFAKAEQMLRRALEVEPMSSAVRYSNLLGNQLSLGKVSAADSTIALAFRYIPRNPAVARMRITFAAHRGKYDSATVVADSLIAARPNDEATRRSVEFELADLYEIRGRFRERAEHLGRARALASRLGNPGAALAAMLDEPETAFWVYEDNERARRGIERVVSHPLFDSLPPESRPYGRLIGLYAMLRMPDRAQATFREWDRVPRPHTPGALRGRQQLLAIMAHGERRFDDALREYRASFNGLGACVACEMLPLAEVHDAAGNRDSAIVHFSRFVDGSDRFLDADSDWLAHGLQRLAELHDAKGEHEQAMSYYARFVELWKDADPELQPRVDKARARLRELQRRTG